MREDAFFPLCRLPVEVSRKAVELLNLADVVRLDSAASNQVFSSYFKQVFAGTILQCPDLILICRSEAVWLKSRNICLTRFSMSRSLFDTWTDDLSCTLREVVCLQFESQSHISRDPRDPTSLQIFSSCPHLCTLNLRDCRLHDNILGEVANLCPLLQDVDLRMSNVEFHNLIPLVQRAVNLTSINLASCLAIKDDTIQAICTTCVGLTSLNASGCSNVTSLSVDAIAAHCSELQHLNMKGWSNVEDGSMVALSMNCRKLRALHFGGCFLTSSVSLYALAANCPGLEDVTLTYTRNVETEAIVALVRRCVQLKKYTGYITDEVLRALSQHSSQLESVMVGRTNGVTGEAVVQLLCNCKALHTLFIMRCGALPSCDGVAARLAVLNLSWCQQRTDEEAISIIKLAPNLRELYLQHCIILGNATVSAVAEHCRDLQVVDLAGLKNVTDTSIVRLAESCTTLRNINLSGCIVLTDRGIISIAQHCAHLTHLNIKIHGVQETTLVFLIVDVLWGRHCSDAAIDALAQHCRQLRELKVCGHPRMTQAALDRLVEALPRCKVSDT